MGGGGVVEVVEVVEVGNQEGRLWISGRGYVGIQHNESINQSGRYRAAWAAKNGIRDA